MRKKALKTSLKDARNAEPQKRHPQEQAELCTMLFAQAAARHARCRLNPAATALFIAANALKK